MNPLTAPVDTAAPAYAAAAAALGDGAYMLLDQYGLIAVTGDDAASFLHNLLTNDIQTLSAGEARLAGFCTPKGRLLASFLAWRDAQSVSLMLSADILAPIQKRLSMFVLRAKAKLADASASTRLIGLTGNVAGLLAPLFGVELPTQPYGVIHAGADLQAGSLIRLPDAAGVSRYVWAVPAQTWTQHAGTFEAKLRCEPASTWDWLAVRAAEPRISAATQEKFVPQMINFEVIGGVNFKKGCYPGQEIVARSQYLGTVKRRAVIAHVTQAQPVAAGTEIFSADDPSQPCGMVVNAAAVPGTEDLAGGIDCLVEIKLDALNRGAVHLGAADGSELSFSALPYAFPMQEAS